MPQRLRIFISSPADVPDERLRASLIVDKLSQDYSRFFTIESYRWEHEAMLASAHFQDAIEPPSAFDIVVLILWSRLGTPLPEKTAEREYHGIDGRAPVTGTEWEYEEALKVALVKKAPDLLAFRNISPAPIDPRDPAAQARSIAQLGALNAFWTRHFADKGVFLAAYDEYRKLEEFAERLEESLRKLIERRIKDASASDPRAEPIWLGEPFRGLEPYEFEHAPIFFGRDAAVTKAAEQLAANAQAGHAFLLVSGASGSGKSSLVKAGIVPRLMKPQRISGAAFLRRTVFRPSAESTDIFLGLAKALLSAGGQDMGLPELIAPGQDAAQLAAYLREAASEPGYIFANALGRLTEAGRKSGLLLAFEVAKAILIIDQVEELFTIAGINPDDRRLFIQLLAGLARSGAVWVIVTLRADFWHRAAEIPELVALAEGPGRIDLAAASPAEIAEMIRKPAQAAGYSFEVHPQTGLGLDAVLAEHAAAAPGALPLLSFTLDELYKNAKTRGATVLTYASYEALGGLEGAIASRADEIVGGLPVSAQAALPRVLRAVTTVTGIADHVPVARSVPLDSFGEGSPARMLVDAFIAARLLVAASDSGAPPTVRLAHEALISRWKRARDQLAGDRRDLETRTLVERQFGRWSHARGRARRLLLLRNPDLASAVDLARRWSEELDAPTRDFIKRSARRARLARTFTAAAVFMLVIGVLAGWQWQIARAQRDRAESALTAAAGTADRLAFDLGVKLRNAPGVADDVVIDVVGRVLNLQMQLAPVGGTQPQLRRLEAAALGEMSNTLSSRGAISSARNAAERAVATMEDLVQLDPTNAQYQRDLAVNLNQLSDVHLRSGDYSAALDLSQRALSVVKKLLAAAPDDANLQDDLAASLTRIGAVLAVTGKVAEALDTFQQTLAFLEQLVAKQPDNLPWQFSLSSAHNRVGLILLQMGQTAAALEAFQAGLVIRQKLVEADPKNAEFQRGLFDSYTRKGDTVARTGAWQEALSAYQDALTIIKKLVATDPGNEQWQNELATAYDKVGQLQMLGKASDQALDSFRNSAAIREQLVASVNIDRERAIEVSYNKIADILIATGKRAEAVRSYQDALAIAQRLLSAAPPERTEWLNDLAFCYVKLGTVYATDNRAQAHDFYQKAIAIREQLVASDKTDVRFQRGLALTYEALASLAVGEKSNAEAAASLRKAVALREQIATSDSDNAMWQFDLALSLFWLAQVGDDPQTHYQQALAIVQKLDDAGKLTADQKALIVAIQQAQAALPAHK